jgi:hypothetical protein
VTIEQATGIIAERHDLPVDRALGQLHQLASIAGRPLFDVAAEIVNDLRREG